MIFKGQSINEGLYLTAEAAIKYNTIDIVEKGLVEPIIFTIYKINEQSGSKIHIGTTSLAPMPGCCGVVVSYHTELKADFRGSGLSNPFRDLKHDLIKALGYSAVVATTQLDNVPAVVNMVKSKYKIVRTFLNRRSGKLLGFGIKTL